jgi:hypothetical protein
MPRLPDAFPADASGNAATRHKAGPVARSGIDLTGPLPAALALLGCALYAVTLAPVSDHGWQFYMAERMLDGADLYIDVGAADMHPPLFTWLAMAIAAFGRLVNIDGLTLYPVVVLLVVAGSLESSRRLLQASGWMLAVLVLAFMPMAGPFYGQGEHLALVLAFPYFAGAAAAIRGHPASRGAIAAGIAAGIGSRSSRISRWSGLVSNSSSRNAEAFARCCGPKASRSLPYSCCMYWPRSHSRPSFSVPCRG